VEGSVVRDSDRVQANWEDPPEPPHEPPTAAELITDAERYFTDKGGSLFPVEWADAAIDLLRDTTYGYRVALDLREWMQNPEPRLDDALIKEAVAALRMVAT
jgi:hypothetical protein